MRGTFRPKPQSVRDAILERRLDEIERGNWEQKVEDYRKGKLAFPPIGGGMPTKDRFSLSSALVGDPRSTSGWEIPDLVDFEYSYLNLSGATTFNGFILGVMPGSNAGLIGSPDSLGPSLAVASASRVAASGQYPYATLLSAWIFSRASGGTVYTAAAGTTLQPFVISSAASANQIATALTAAAQSIPALTTFWTQLTLAAPADRGVNIRGGSAVAGIVSLYYGDALMGQLVTTGALNILGNNLALVLELA